MAKHLNLTIADPCHEDWDKMTPSEKGRFCDACKKQVVDFTNMSDSQVIAFFKKETTGSVCGRFYDDQLGKDLEVPRKRLPWVKYFFQFTLPLFLTSIKSYGQQKKIEDIVVIGGQVTVKGAIPFESEIKGVVLTEDGKPVPFATIMISETTRGVSADSTGAFSLPLMNKTKEMKISVSSVGFETQEIKISKKDIKNEKEITVRLKTKTLNDVTVVSYGWIRCRSVTGGVVTVWKSRRDQIIKEDTNTSSSMIAYPNPVQAGKSITIRPAKMDEGYYSFQLQSINGQRVHQQEVWIDNEAKVLNLPIPAVAVGTYLISLSNKKSGKTISEKLIVQ